jgi:hypothetical protein
MSFALQALKPGGVFIIEDVPDRSLSIWQVISCSMQAFNPALIRAKGGNLFVIEKPKT